MSDDGALAAAPMSEYSWLAAFDREDLTELVTEMLAALDASVAARDAEPVTTCLRQWRVTGEALSGPGWALLTGAGDDDYEEVFRP